MKTKIMAGQTLGQAIHDLKPQVSAQAEVKKAKRQANEDLKESAAKS